MLKQILRDMYIDPEILAGLDDTQKQTLFCKMREEQIRRWRIWDQQQIEQKSNDIDQSSAMKRHVQFRNGEDGEPWVWIMGEHADDRTIDEILADEAKQKARQLAEIETKELRKSYEAELSDIITYEPIPKINDNHHHHHNHHHMQTDEIIDDLEIYCSVDELRDRINHAKAYASPKLTNNIKQLQNIYNSRISNFNLTCIQPEQPAEILKEISNNKPSQKVSARILLWEKRMIGEKTNEIYRRLQKKQQETVKEVEEAAKKHEALWQEQERKAKEAENQIREIARRAREEHRKSVNVEQSATDIECSSSQMMINSSSPPLSLDSNISRPLNQDAVVKWYRNEEFPRNSGIDLKSGKPYQWFYGLVSRNDAEQMLLTELSGTFLVRLSEKIWGYAISYKDNDRCKHYLVDASGGMYKFLGPNQLSHNNLGNLFIN